MGHSHVDKCSHMLAFGLRYFSRMVLFFRAFTDLRNILEKVDQVCKMSCFEDRSCHKRVRQKVLHTECSCICQLLSKTLKYSYVYALLINIL